jgi:uncharacterized membrane protein
MVFLTNGTKKNITIGKSSILFQPTTTKKLAMVGSISSLLFLGLEELDLNRLTESELEKIINHQVLQHFQLYRNLHLHLLKKSYWKI